MHVKQKVNIHNRFDVEVRDGITGELKETAVAFNIILTSMWTRLCGGSTYFVNIHFGTGSGSLSAARTTLFTHLGTKAVTNVEQIKALPVSSWKQKIVLNPEEFVGLTITEVGIAYGATNTNLVTHAMLKDAEGNPISITKTALDVITIYATVFVTIVNQNGIQMLSMPTSNTLINYLIGGAAAPTGSFGLLPFLGANARLGSTASATWTADTANKKRKTNTPRFDINTGNGHVKVYEFTNLFAVELPVTGIFTGQPYTAVPVGTGDGVKTKFTIPSANINQATLAMKISGAVVNNYIKKTLLIEFTRIKDPASLPPNYAYGVALTPDGLIMAVAHDGSPFITTYDWVERAWIKRANPTYLPAGTGMGVALTPDGLIMAVGHSLSPYITTYDWVGGAWVNRANPTSLPTSTGRGVALTPDGLIMVVAHSASPFIATYDWVGGAWVKRANPAILPAGTGRGVALTPDGLIMAVAHDNSPYITTYDWVGGAWVKRANPASLPINYANGVALTPDGLIMAVAHASSPYITTYDWVEGAWVNRANPTSLPAGNGTGVALTPDGLIMAVGHNTTPFVTTYDWVEGAWVKRANPAILPTDNSRSISLTPDGLIMAVGHDGSLFITTYKALSFIEVTFDTPVAGAQPITADYTVDGLHKTDQYVVDVSFEIIFGEGV